MFEKVDGLPNQKVMVEPALGRRPVFPHRKGPFACAAKFMLSRYEDALVKPVPDDAEVRTAEEQVSGTLTQISVSEGLRLSELQDQDAYSNELVDIWVGAQNEEEWMRNYRKCMD